MNTVRPKYPHWEAKVLTLGGQSTHIGRPKYPHGEVQVPTLGGTSTHIGRPQYPHGEVQVPIERPKYPSCNRLVAV